MTCQRRAAFALSPCPVRLRQRCPVQSVHYPHAQLLDDACAQINDWFTNWRARVWKRDVHAHDSLSWRSAVTKVLALVRAVKWYRRACGRHLLHCESAGVVVRDNLERLQLNS